jgi:O-antigen/teichoic acid export membrane protein
MTLSFGTIISQGIGFMVLPILSRLYSPDEFGLFYSFTGIAQIICLVSTLKYEKSIILPQNRNEGNILVFLTLIIVSIYSIIVSLIVANLYFFSINVGTIQSYLFLIPLSVFVYAFLNIVLLWYQREEKFKAISIINISQSLIVMSLSVLLGIFKWQQNGLISAYVWGCSTLVTIIMILNYSNFFKIFSRIKKEDLVFNLKKYADFPKYYLGYDLLLSGTSFITPVILATLYTKTECGLFSMAMRILSVPYIIISISVSNVFIVNAKKAYSTHNNFKDLYVSTFKKLSILGLIIYSITFFFGDVLVSKLLGSQWNDIGLFVKIISVSTFFEFVTYVFRSNTYIIVQKQKVGLVIQALNTILSLSTLILLKQYGILSALMAFSFITIIFSSINLYVTYTYSKKVQLY